MITEDYCSFEVAKLLKEKGFDEGCNSYFISDNEIALISNRRDFNNHGVYLSAPTHQMAMKWLREVHKIGIFPNTYTFVNGDNKSIVYGTAIVNLTTHELMINDIMERDAYEEAVEAALKYSLKNLI